MMSLYEISLITTSAFVDFVFAVVLVTSQVPWSQISSAPGTGRYGWVSRLI